MSRTDKTDPHRVKVARYGEHYWMPIHRCPCSACRSDWLLLQRKYLRRTSRAMVRNWHREYESA